MMTSSKPYLIRSIYQWIIDNELTPYIVVNAQFLGLQVPEQYIEDGRIVLNISPRACRGLHLENDRIVFSARFSGLAMQIFVPPAAVMAVYAKENGRGMVFTEEEEIDDSPPPPSATAPGAPGATNIRGKPQLKVIK